MKPFTMLIAPTCVPTFAPSYQHPFHLGTDETLARQLVEERFHGEAGIDTIVLIRGDKIVDVFDGIWSSKRYGLE